MPPSMLECRPVEQRGPGTNYAADPDLVAVIVSKHDIDYNPIFVLFKGFLIFLTSMSTVEEVHRPARRGMTDAGLPARPIREKQR